MTDVSYPKVGPGGWNMPQWRKYHERDTGIVGSVSGSDGQIFADGSGPYIKRLPRARYIQGVFTSDDETWQGTVDANATGSWRVDRVVDELDADGNITTVIVPGTAGDPSPPALTRIEGGTWQDHLGYFQVRPGFTNITTTDAAVVDERRFMPARVTPVASEATRPSSPLVGDEVVFSSGVRQRWTGSVWVTVGTPDSLDPRLSANSPAATWATGSAFTYRHGGGLVTLEGQLFTGAQIGTTGHNVVVSNVPAPYFGTGTTLPFGSFVYNGNQCQGVWNSTSSCWFLYGSTGSAIVGPIPAGTSLQLHATYREA